MTIERARMLALSCLILTPILLTLWLRISLDGRCQHVGDGSLSLFLPFALALLFSANPWRVVAACLAYLPIGYLFGAEPHTPPQSQGSGGLIYVIWPIFALWVLFWAFVGGGILRVLFGQSNTRPVSIAAQSAIDSAREDSSPR